MPSQQSKVEAHRAVGAIYLFGNDAGSWKSDSDIEDVLTELKDTAGMRTAWRYTVASDDSVETYNALGQLISIVNRAGFAQTLTYSDGTTGPNGGYLLDAYGNATSTVIPPGLLLRVTDATDRTLSFGYNASSRLSTITDPAGGLITYGYDAQSNLVSVTYPDGRGKTYHYNEPANTAGANLSHALTGITDENGVRFATYQYAANGKATATGHAAGADLHNLTYNPDGSTTVTDPIGTQRTHTFTTILGVVKSTGQSQPGGSGCGPASSATTYDANGNVASRADFSGNQTCYAYDLTRNLETARVEGLAPGTACPTSLATYTPVAGTAQRKILTDWHATLRLPIKITEAGRETSTVYDTRGNVTSTTLKDTATAKTRTWSTAYTYHASVPGVLVQKIDNGPRIDVSDLTTTDYYAPDENCLGGHFGCRGQVRQITNALGHVTRVTRYNAHGQPEESIDPNGLVTMLAYDARQRLVSRTVGLEATGFQYDNAGQLMQITRPDSSTLNYTYDPAHRLTRISDGLGNKIVYTLDAMGNRTQEDIVDPAGALVQTRRSEYDALNRLAKDIGAANQTTQYTYDAVGNATGTTNPLNHATTQSHDALNRLAQRIDASGGTTRIARDPRDNPTAVTDPRANATQYTYDGLDNLIRETSPDRGVITTTYDDAGNPLTVTDARGVKHTTTYDALNRPTQRSHTPVTGVAATPAINWVYDQGVNGIGRLTRMGDATGTTVYAYDRHGRLLSTTQTTSLSGASLTHTLAATYDPAGRLSGQTYPSGLQVGIAYDLQGQVTSLSLNAQPLLSQIAYQPFGAVRSWVWSNGRPHTRGFDPDGRLTVYPIGSDTRLLTYDAASRITATTHGNPAYNRGYTYDAQDRLLTYSDNLGSQTYRYDPNGNRISIDYGTGPYAYTTAAASNRLSKVAGPVVKTYLYNAAGSPTSDGTTTFSWDAAGRLIKIASGKGKLAISASYLYNGFGQRLIKDNPALVNPPHRFVFDPAGHLIGEYDKANSVRQETVWLGDIPVAVVKPGPTSGQRLVYYVQADHLNTPRVILDNAHTAVWRWDNSDAFGVGQPNEDPDGDGKKFEYNPRFPGQYFDRETNLHYNYFRDYDPGTGRYIEADPIGLDGGLNLYLYANAAPTMYTDPLGLFTSRGHNTITTDAIAIAGSPCPNLSAEAAMADWLPGAQNPQNSHWHAMRDGTNPDSTVESARGDFNNFLNAQWKSCSCEGLARALHAIQDSYARGHANFQPWGGGLPSPSHVYHDGYPSRNERARAVKASVDLIRRYTKECANQCPK